MRSSAAIALGGMADSSYIPLFQNIINNSGELKEVRMYCAYAIGRTGDPAVIDILTPIVDNEMEDLNVRLWAIAGLAFVKNETIFPKLIYFSKVDNVRIRLEAIKALSKFSNSQSIEVLTFKALYDPEFAVKKEAKKGLQTLGIDVDKLGKETNTNTALMFNTNRILNNTNKTITSSNNKTNTQK